MKPSTQSQSPNQASAFRNLEAEETMAVFIQPLDEHVSESDRWCQEPGSFRARGVQLFLLHKFAQVIGLSDSWHDWVSLESKAPMPLLEDTFLDALHVALKQRAEMQPVCW